MHFAPTSRMKMTFRQLIIYLSIFTGKFLSAHEPSYAHERTDWTTRELGRIEARQWVTRARPFALMSELAYQGSSVTSSRRQLQQKFRSELEREGWCLKTNRLDVSSLNEDSPGLHFYVWERRTQTNRFLTFAFRGTDSGDLEDLRANLRWFLPIFRKTDQYAQAHREVLKYLHENISAEETNVIVATTGHSLGGGIAQGMFYASYILPTNSRISQCYAFDPSPVTGAFQIGDRQQRKAARAARNAEQKRLASEKVKGESALNHFDFGTARIFEQGEILAYIRGPLRRLWPLHSLITEVRFDLLDGANGLKNHGMSTLAEGLYQMKPTD